MCGITGFFSRDPDSARSERELVAMGESMRYRGPDAFGSTLARGVGLHSRRLAILDLSPDGNQPMYAADGKVAIVFNGEVYNFMEIRRELEGRGHRFRSKSDTEVVLQGFVEWGIEPLLKRLNGFFGFAIHDCRPQAGAAGTLHVVRDRLGVKPMYWAETARGLVFGSELKTLLAEGSLARDLDPKALLEFLCLRYIPAPRTIYRGAQKLPAGHYLTVRLKENGGAGGSGALETKVTQYWDVKQFGTRRDSPEKLAEEIWALVVDSVRLRLISDVPLGAFLSGGLDSSAVVAAMAQLSKQNGGGGGDVTAVTIGFKGWDQSEVEHARLVARSLGVRHIVDELEPAALELVDTLATHFDEPFSDPSAIPTYLLSKRARQEVTVALSGDGGDECFAGYRRYRFDQAEHRVRSLLPGPFLRGLWKTAGALYPGGDFLPRPLRAKTTLQNLGRTPADAYFRSVCQMDVASARALLHPDLRAGVEGHDPAELIRPWYAAAPSSDPLARAQYCDLHTWLPDYILTKSDRATMAVSLEGREPLLDYRLVELAASIPSEWKLREKVGKWIFRRAVAPHLPKHTITRGKQGFAPPLKEWVKRELEKDAGGKSERLVAPRSIDPAAYAALLERHHSGRRDLSEPLYSLLVLRAFEQRWLGAGGS